VNISNSTVKEIAARLGFSLVGFSKCGQLEHEIDNLKTWLSKNYHANMNYMADNLEKKSDPGLILENAESIISLGYNYYNDESHDVLEGHGKVSRYAWSKDYHIILWEKLSELIDELQSVDSEFNAKAYVDTGPVMDKVWAVKSGLGWMGKHTNVISREIGSWFFISTVITNFIFDYSKIDTDHCGSCTACIEACPTDAIIDEYVLDSTKCISYLTIENKGEIPAEFNKHFDDWIFGCDICQNVCPWNKKFSVLTSDHDFLHPVNKQLNFSEIDEMTNSQFKKKFSISPISRARLKGLKRNAEFIK